MTALRSLLFNILFAVGSLAILSCGMPSLLMSRRAIYVVGHAWSRSTLRGLAAICGITHEIRGRENLPDGKFLIASKHQSAWDTLIFEEILHEPGYVIKKELFQIPLIGWYMRKSGYLAVDRAGGAKALRRLIRQAGETLAEGRALVIYPEGTRSAPGQTRAYHPGVAALYTQLQVPVVPVALNSGLFWGRRAFLKHPGRITLQILPPIAPGLPRRAFMAELRRRIEDTSEDLRQEAATAAGHPPPVDKSVGGCSRP